MFNMSLTWRDYWSQDTLVLTKRCNLRCGFCPLWRTDVMTRPEERATDQPTPVQVDRKAMRALQERARSGELVARFKHTRLVNVVGGEPFLFEGLPTVLRALKDAGKKVRFWSNGLFSHEHWERVAPLMDVVMLYVPSSEPELYRDIAGYAGLKQLNDMIPHIKQWTSVHLHHPTTPETVAFLPEFYDLAYGFQLPFMIHYNPKLNFQRDSIHWINRYKGYHNATVLKTNYGLGKLCAAIPKQCHAKPRDQQIENAIEMIEHIRNHVSLNKWLKRRLG